MNPIRKYPRTQHLAGSGLQPGDEDLDAVPVSDLRGKYVVVEEKMDGANCGASFGPDCGLLLQSRGHYLLGGPREKQFALFKQWASSLADRLLDRLETRYVLYGEWLYAKHSVYYDLLPHYFLEFDVLDTETGTFLDTPRRAELLAGLPVAPVKVLYAGRRARALPRRSRAAGVGRRASGEADRPQRHHGGAVREGRGDGRGH